MNRQEQPGLEVVPQESGLHPVYPEAHALIDDPRKAQPPPAYGGYYKANESEIPTIQPVVTAPRRRRRRYWIIGGVVVAIIILIIVIAVPVVVTRNKDSGDVASPATSSPADSGSTAPMPTVTANPYASTNGAFNGSGIAVLPGAGSTTARQLVFQHASGQLRQSNWTGGSWTGGTNSAGNIVLASGARNGTPIATVSYGNRSDTTSRILYVDQNDVLQDIVQNGAGQPWVAGFLGSNNFKVYKALGASLSMTAVNNWSNPDSTQDMGANGGVTVYWPGADGRFREAALPYNKNTWNTQFTFDDTLDGSSGIDTAVYPLVTYLWAVKRSGSYVCYYYKPNGNVWKLGTISNVSTAVGSALSFTNGATLFFQDSNSNVMTLNTSSNLSDGVWKVPTRVGGSSISALSGTRLASGSFTNSSLRTTEVYFQTGGNSIAQLTSGPALQSWTQRAVSVGE